MSEGIVQSRANQEPVGFQYALKYWRRFAHSRELVVVSPSRLVGAERTFFGDSDEENFGPKDYRLVNSEILFDGDVYMNKAEKKALTEIAERLIDMGEVDIKDCRAPSSARVPPHEDERGRWDLWLTKDHRVGTVVRVGEGSKKHYYLYLWDGAWYRVSGQPCYDIPMFGLVDLRAEENKPVMIHEGPKAWEGACAAADQTTTPGHLSNWMGQFVHVGWHGADIGMEWTDWSPLRGRKVLIWSDMDERGVTTASALARKLARMGGIVEYVRWGSDDLAAMPNWDWGDYTRGELPEGMTRAEIRARIVQVESPINVKGEIHKEWMERSFFDQVEGEVYQQSDGYKPIPLVALSREFGKDIPYKIATSEIREYVGTTYRPGARYGRMKDGRINTCRPHFREPIEAAPLAGEVYKEMIRRWLGRMVPNRLQRKHLIRKICWAIARPEKMSQHMIILQGMSGIGKSVLMDAICGVSGPERGGAVYPDSIFKSFNDSIKDKSIICIHEIHSDDITRKQNASRLKELVGNTHITVREKYRNDSLRDNVVHWFGATNEKVPFALENGNDRFFFVDCVGPETPRDKKKMRDFFSEWIPKMHDPLFQDQLYAAAKHIALNMPEEHSQVITGRSRRQRVWKTLEQSSMRAWEQFLFLRLQELEGEWGEIKEEDRSFFAFFGQDMVRLTHKEHPRVGEFDIRNKMNEFGYASLRSEKGIPVSRRLKSGRREPIWVRKVDANAIAAQGGFGELRICSLVGAAET